MLIVIKLAGMMGLEPTAFRLTIYCANQLRHIPIKTIPKPQRASRTPNLGNGEPTTATQWSAKLRTGSSLLLELGVLIDLSAINRLDLERSSDVPAPS